MAYADDLAVVVTGNSRRELEERGAIMADTINDWCVMQGLTISKSKTEMILLRDGKRKPGKSKVMSYGVEGKRQLTHGSIARSISGTSKGIRPPIIKIDGKSIKYSGYVKYLGVTIATGFSILAHVMTCGKKAKGLFMKLRRVAGIEWGITSDALTEIYRAVFLSVMLYAAGAWGDLVNATIRRHLVSQQRTALIMLTKAYRTVSTPALQVLAAQLPLDLMVKLRYHMYKVRIKEPFKMNQVTYTGDEDGNETIKSLRNEIHSGWQDRWSTETKGRQTRT